MPQFKVQGLTEIDKILQNLPAATAKASVRRVLKKAGQPIADAGAANAPKAEGHLRASYGVGTKLTKRQRKVSPKKSAVEVYVGPNDPSAVQTEFGNDHQPAQPHLRPAWDANQKQTLEIIQVELWSDVTKTVDRFNIRQAKKAK